MTSLFELVNQLAVRAVGRRPRWAVQEDTDGAPSSLSAGVSTGGAVVDRLQVDLREEVHRKVGKITVDGINSGVEFQVLIDGAEVNYAVSSTDTLADVLQGIADAINGDVTTGALVTATYDPDNDRVNVVGDDETDYTFVVGISIAGSGGESISATCDASTASLRIFRLPAGTSTDRPGWALYDTIEGLDYRGDQIEVPAAGFSRIYVELFDVEEASGTGSSISAEPLVTVTHGPAGDE